MKGVVSFLDLVIWCYNHLFRASQTIMTLFSIGIFLAVYSILPVISFAFCVSTTAFLSGLSVSELYQRAIENVALFVSLGMGFAALFITEVILVVLAQNNNVLTNLENYLVSKSNQKYSAFIRKARDFIIGVYRETGWEVLGLSFVNTLFVRSLCDDVPFIIGLSLCLIRNSG